MKVFCGMVLLLLGATAGFVWTTLHWTYSEGQRAGYVQKLSHRGWACKTWEGELAMATIPGTLAEHFRFSVSSDAVAAKLNATAGRQVALRYEQHKWVPTSCFGDTEYFATDVRVIEPESP
jgi:hypothetical protein